MPIDLPPPIKIELQRSITENPFLISDASRKTKKPKLKQFPYVPPLESKPNLTKYNPPLKGLVHFWKGPMAFPEIESMRVPDGWTEEYVMPIGAPGPREHRFRKKGDSWSRLDLSCFGSEQEHDKSKLLDDTLRAAPHEIVGEELDLLRKNKISSEALPIAGQVAYARTKDWNGRTVIESQGVNKDGDHFYAITYGVPSFGRAPTVESTIIFVANTDKFKKYLPAMKKSMRSIKWTDSKKTN
ncbi:MAG: hypothetical protein R3C24_07710 [Cyanobacteriota/Melainabacteria group bacterium]